MAVLQKGHLLTSNRTHEHILISRVHSASPARCGGAQDARATHFPRKIPTILTTGHLPPASPGVSGRWGSYFAPGGPLQVRWQSAVSGTLIITLPNTPRPPEECQKLGMVTDFGVMFPGHGILIAELYSRGVGRRSGVARASVDCFEARANAPVAPSAGLI